MNIIQSIFNKKCPRCRKGDLFFPFKSMGDILKMHEHCSHCGQPTEPEPGFYYGAMFISYIVTGFLYLGIIAFLIMGFGLTVNQSFLILLVFVLITYVQTARLARSAWIHVIVKYQSND